MRAVGAVCENGNAVASFVKTVTKIIVDNNIALEYLTEN